MRSTFGDLAARRRHELGLSLHEFAQNLGVSHARVSQLEHTKAHISDDTVKSYFYALGISRESELGMRMVEAAGFSNSRHLFRKKSYEDDRLLAMLANYSRFLSDEAKLEIMSIIKREAEGKDLSLLTEGGEKASLKQQIPLQVAGKQRASLSRRRKQAGFTKRMNSQSIHMETSRFADLVLKSERIRDSFTIPDESIQVDKFLEAASVNELVDVDVVEAMPNFASEAYAVIVGSATGHTIIVEQGYYKACAERRNYFANHVLLHEYSHHVLHGDLLKSDHDSYLDPHQLALIFENQLVRSEPLYEAEFVGDFSRKYVIPNSIELEAEIFATLLAVPWTKIVAYLNHNVSALNTSILLGKDYKALPHLVERVAKYLKAEPARNAIKERLFRSGDRSHPFLSMQ